MNTDNRALTELEAIAAVKATGEQARALSILADRHGPLGLRLAWIPMMLVAVAAFSSLDLPLLAKVVLGSTSAAAFCAFVELLRVQRRLDAAITLLTLQTRADASSSSAGG